MGNLHLALLFLACYAVLPLRPALGQGIDNSTVFPSLAKNLTCTGLGGFVDGNATFEQKSSFSKTSPILLGLENTDRCENTDLKDVHVKYGENFDPKIVGNESWTCNVYGNGYINFTVMDLIIFKPDSNRDNKLACTYDGKPCPVVSESDKEYRVVVGMPSNCTAYVDPKGSETTAAPENYTTAKPKRLPVSSNSTPVPSETSLLTCTEPNGNILFAQRNSNVLSEPFVKGSEITVRCENSYLQDTRVKYGDKFDTSSVVNATWTCFTYVNGSKNFTVIELALFKPANSNGTNATCKFDDKDCPLVRDSEKESRFVIGMPSNCTAYLGSNRREVELNTTTEEPSPSTSTTAEDYVYVLPSETRDLICPGKDYYYYEDKVFWKTYSFNTTRPFVEGAEVTARCEGSELGEVRIKYGENFDPSSVGNFSWNCTTYEHRYENFTVMELTVNKPRNNTNVTCTYDYGRRCPLVSENWRESRFVIGMPSGCRAYFDSTTTERPRTTWEPARDCGSLTLESSNATFSPSQVAVVNCTRSCCGYYAWQTCYDCPQLVYVSMEGVRVQTRARTSRGAGRCTATLEMFLTGMSRERVQVPVECSYYDGGAMQVDYVTFQKSLHSEACKHDVDCLGDLWCQRGRCACPRGKPVFVPYSNECYPMMGPEAKD